MAVQIPEEETGPHFKSRALRDREDLQLELGGQDTGRQIRFLAGEHSPRAIEERKKKEEERRFNSLLEMLLRDDPRYARLHADVSEKLEKARQAVDLALLDIKQRLEASERKLQKMRDEAGMLPDGTRVFRSSTDNGIYTEDGQRLSANDAQRIAIPQGAPSWEHYDASRRESQALRQESGAVERYRDKVLTPAQERLSNEDDPPSLEELEDIQNRVLQSAPQSVAARMPIAATTAASSSTISVAHAGVSRTRLDVPDLREIFDAATASSTGGLIHLGQPTKTLSPSAR